MSNWEKEEYFEMDYKGEAAKAKKESLKIRK